MASQQPPERRPKIVDLNLLPPEYLPRKVSKLSIALVLLIIVMVCLPLPFIFLKAGVDAELPPLETRLAQLTGEYLDLQAIAVEGRELEDQIDVAKSKLENMDQDYETFLENLVLWSEIIYEIDDAIPGTRVTVRSITVKGSTITLIGAATKDDYIWDYATALEESEYFSGVTPTSIVTTGAGVSFTMNVPLSGGGG